MILRFSGSQVLALCCAAMRSVAGGSRRDVCGGGSGRRWREISECIVVYKTPLQQSCVVVIRTSMWIGTHLFVQHAGSL